MSSRGILVGVFRTSSLSRRLWPYSCIGPEGSVSWFAAPLLGKEAEGLEFLKLRVKGRVNLHPDPDLKLSAHFTTVPRG